MGRFIQQPNEGMPNGGVQTIIHLIKTFDFEDDPAVLDTTVNAWFLGLISMTSTPIIKDVKYSTLITTAPMPVIMYSSQVHYVLVE